MKKVLLSLLLLCISGLLYAGNSVTVNTSDGKPGDTVTVQVSISASDRFAAGEFTFPIAEGYSFVEGSFQSHVSSMSSSSTLSGVGLKAYFMGALQVYNGALFSFKIKLGTVPVVFRMEPVVILSDAQGNALNVTVTGSDVTVKASQIKVSLEQVDYGHISIRSAHKQSLSISNTGTISLNVSSIVGTSNELRVSETSFTVPAGESKLVDISYVPSLPGSKELTLVIESDAVDNATCSIPVVADAYSVNVFKVGSSAGETDSVISIDLFMDNMDDIAAFQCNLNLPDGVSYVDGSFAPSDRLKDMKCFPSFDNGSLSLYVYSESEQVINEGTGKVASFRLYLGSTNGTHNLIPEDVILVDREHINVLSGIQEGSIEIKSPLIACESVFDLGVTALPDKSAGYFQILNNGKKDLVIDKVVFDNALFLPDAEFPFTVRPGKTDSIGIVCNADSTGDYASVMSIYTNVPYNRVVDVDITGSIFAPNFVTSQINLNQDQKSGLLSVSLSNYNTITAIQMNVYGLEEMTVDKSSFSLTERCGDLSSVLTSNKDGSVKVLIYSLDNKCISGNSGELFSFRFSGDRILDDDFSVRIKDVVISDEKGKNISSMKTTSSNEEDDNQEGEAEDTVGVLNPPTKVVCPVTVEPDREDLFDLLGRRIYADPSALPPGIYIRNGRKFRTH